MAFLPTNSIDHFSHPGHPLNSIDINKEFLCGGCKTPGNGKRYNCNGCNFDMHDYCGTCPRLLTSFMHRHHALTLLIREPKETRQVDRICDICRDAVEGLFYRCMKCDFNVHPVCTQLPERLHHALDKIHPLVLQSLLVASFCDVCKKSCSGWRYRCGTCNFDIHLECVLKPVVPCPRQHEQTNHRAIPMFDQRVVFQPPRLFAPYYGFPYGLGYPNSGPGFMHHGGPYMYPQHFGPQNHQVGGSNSNDSGIGRLGKYMFSLVGQLGSGVLANMIFGVDISSLFAD